MKCQIGKVYNIAKYMFIYSRVSRYPKPIYNVAMTVVMNYLVVSNKDFVSLRIFTLYHLWLARVVLKMFGFIVKSEPYLILF